MSADQTQDDFDWVGAQARCSAGTLFARLRASVSQDVERRNTLKDEEDDWNFEFQEDGEAYEVARLVPSPFSQSKVAALVRFERAGRRIHVRGEGVDVDLTAIVALDPAGVCRFIVGEAMYSEWEFRRMALEQLFFEEAEESD